MNDMYISEPNRIVIWLDSRVTYRQFNSIMESRGCPIRASGDSDTSACLLAAFDWLASQVARSENA